MYTVKVKKIKKRRYNTRLIKTTMSYTVYDITALFGIHKGTALNWIKEGLKIIDQRKPYLIYGEHLFQFLKARQLKRKHVSQINEIYCFKCRRPQSLSQNSVLLDLNIQKRIRVEARCIDCNTKTFRNYSIKQTQEIIDRLPLTTLQQEHLIKYADHSTSTDFRKII